MSSGKDGSVAPKERVNIVYKPATGDAKAQVELPLKLLVTGDFTNRKDERPVESRDKISIDKDNFNGVMRDQQLGVTINVKNTLSGKEGDELKVDLKLDSMKSFEPDQVARQVPELNQMLELRNALVALKGPLGNVPAFKKKIQDLLADPATRDKLLSEITRATEGGA